jgi:hypothetical protein
MSLQPFRFLDLPPEIRQKIYTIICTSPLRCVPLDVAGAHFGFPSNLLLTSSQIYHEVRPVYFSANPFCTTVRRQNIEWAYFLSPSFQDNRRQVRNLTISLLRWGSKDFFLEVLIPLLEDCILNGRLRCLELRVTAKWFYSQRSVGGVGEYVLKGHALDVIRKVLADPYLESGILQAGFIGGLDCCSPDLYGDCDLKNVTGKLFEVREG